MKLFLSLLVMVLALAGLIVVLKPPNKNKKKSQPRLKSKPRSATGKTPPQLKPKPSPALPRTAQKDQAEESTGEPSMEEIRQAVRRYVNKFPGVTADIMGDWMKKR